MTMRTNCLLAAVVMAAAGPLHAAGVLGTVSINLPPETAKLKPGPNVDLVGQKCLICHSAEYVSMQPPLREAEWRGEVMKMKKVMGAPIADTDVDPIVKYLMQQNGKK